MSTRRQPLKNLRTTNTTNAGLWLDKFILDQAKTDKESRRTLVKEASKIQIPREYAHFFEQWKKTLNNFGAEYREAKVEGRMAIGLGEESVLETSVTLHHTYGVPYIPGSALKGLAAAFARQYLGDHWQAETQACRIAFGDMENAGYIIFFDALPKPENVALHRDIITVHHKKYYQNAHPEPPADWDDPTPIPFLSASGEYLVALAGPPVWVNAIFDILKHALAHSGIGAKTSSGYGRLSLSPPLVDLDKGKADTMINSIQSLSVAEVAGRIHGFYELWTNLEMNPTHKCRVAETIVKKIKESGREKQSRGKDWYKELIEYTRKND